MASLHGNT